MKAFTDTFPCPQPGHVEFVLRLGKARLPRLKVLLETAIGGKVADKRKGEYVAMTFGTLAGMDRGTAERLAGAFGLEAAATTAAADLIQDRGNRLADLLVAEGLADPSWFRGAD